MQLYYAHIHSRLTYCLPVWSGCSLEQKMRLQRLQNKVIKFINFRPYLTPSNILYSNQFLPFLKLCDYESILYIHKIRVGLVKSDVALYTNGSITARKTRQSCLLRQPNFLMAKSQNSIFYRGIGCYNEFVKTNELKTFTLSQIKIILKHHTYSHAYSNN